MPTTLAGQRVAVFATREGPALRAALSSEGADVELLSSDSPQDEASWHAARYAALVVGECPDDGDAERAHPKVVQLIREFLLADKPIAIVGGGTAGLEQAGGAPEDAAVVAPAGGDLAAVARKLAVRLGEKLEERRVDEMSDQSFPASDPPATSPASIGHLDRQVDSRP